MSLPLAAGLLTAAPSAHADVDIAAFTGTFQSNCAMPYGPEGPQSGPYTCNHSAMSVACAAVVDTGTAGAHVDRCRADLTSGYTMGHASLATSSVGEWRCDDGFGAGTFRYYPSAAEPALIFGVYLTVVGGDVLVDGSYVQAGTNRLIVVRAHFPAVCAAETSGPGYVGTVTPV
jgi:hypothetical protein